MKKIILFFAGVMTLFATSCSDMLDVDGSREVEMPDMNQKTDSLFFAAGIMQAMQQAAEVYVIQNEMRGDLVTTTEHSDHNLRELANFTAGTTNKYDSAYVYYKVVNNCNYYLAHRDTALYDGATNVTLEEYAAVLSFRAWAYLQLTRTYGKVKFFTEPLTSLSQIEGDDSPVYGIAEITRELESELKKFANLSVPYGNVTLPGNSSVILGRCCIPVNVILGDLYLESNRYSDAAQCYYEFFFNNKVLAQNILASYTVGSGNNRRLNPRNPNISRPNDISLESSGDWFSNSFSLSANMAGVADNYGTSVLSYVPMATNSRNGYTAELPKLFGYNYYYNTATDNNEDSVWLEKKQIVPSKAYYDMADYADFYYLNNDPTAPEYKVIEEFGDMRATSRVAEVQMRNSSETREYIRIYTNTNSRGVNSNTSYPTVILYRVSTVWLHLAEALNRMGHPDAAFAILKDGLRDEVLNYSYLTKPTYDLLTTNSVAPFCLKLANGVQSEQSLLFSNGTKRNYGIHRYGCSDASGLGEGSLYRMPDQVEKKIAELQEALNITVTENTQRAADVAATEQAIADIEAKAELTDEDRAELQRLTDELKWLRREVGSLGKRDMADVINAIEDIICDEYAMELAFEGSRFADLARLARHKNAAGTYGSTFGSTWLADKLKANNPGKNLTEESNWYLPMK